MAPAASGRSVEASGRTVEAAVEAALTRLGRTAEQVDVQILREPSRGMLGFGAHDAIVRVTEKPAGARGVVGADYQPPAVAWAEVSATATNELDEDEEIDDSWEEVQPSGASPVASFTTDDFDDTNGGDTDLDALPLAADGFAMGGVARNTASPQDFDDTDDDEAAAQADSKPTPAPVTVSPEELLEIGREVLVTILQKMRLNADVLASWSEPYTEDEEPALLLEVVGDDLGLLIGRRGETLRDLQYIVRLIVSKRIGGISNIVVDVEEYKARRERTLRQLARRMAERVVATGRPVHMEPMNSYERRIIHMELQTMGGIYTQSAGEGERRKVGIYPGTSRG